jgi:hypothetical protein
VVKAPGANNFNIDKLAYTRIGRRAILLEVSQISVFREIALLQCPLDESCSQDIRSRARLHRTFPNNLAITTPTRKASRKPTRLSGNSQSWQNDEHNRDTHQAPQRGSRMSITTIKAAGKADNKQGHIITLEITSGEVYRGKLLEGTRVPSSKSSLPTQSLNYRQPRTT